MERLETGDTSEGHHAEERKRKNAGIHIDADPAGRVQEDDDLDLCCLL